jgi:hypothetical protein
MSERDEFLRSISGSHGEAILKGGEFAFPLLTDPDKRVRGAALIQLSNKCPGELRGAFAEMCQGIAENDPDWGNRVTAIDWLGRHYQRTRNAAIAHFLARLILSEDSCIQVRCFAYLALREVQLGMKARNTIRRLELLERWLSRSQPGGLSGQAPSDATNYPLGADDKDLKEIDFDFVRRILA